MLDPQQDNLASSKPQVTIQTIETIISTNKSPLDDMTSEQYIKLRRFLERQRPPKPAFLHQEDCLLPVQMVGQFACNVCHDSGYVRLDVPVGHPEFGLPQPCRGENNHGCSVQQKLTFNAIKKFSVVPNDLVDMDADWTTFPSSMDKDAIRKMKQYTQRVVEKRIDNLRGALLYGKNQIGKTGLAYCMHQDILAANLPSIFIDSITFFQRMQEARFVKDDPERYSWTMDRFCGVYHLVIDDLGAEKITETREETLYTLLNRRTKSNVITTITSNLDGEGLGLAIGLRTSSRISGRTFRHIRVGGEMCTITGGAKGANE